MDGLSDLFSLLQQIKDDELELSDEQAEALAEELCLENVTINETNYGFKRIPAKEALGVAESIRKELGFSMVSNIELKSFLHFGSILFLASSEEFMESLMDKVLKHVMFTNSNTQGAGGQALFRPVLNNENQATQDALDLYEVVFRSICVNFLRSAQQKGSRLVQMLRSFQAKQDTSE